MLGLASEIRHNLDALAATYDRQLRAIEAYAEMPPASRLELAHRQLALVARCLEIEDSTPFLQAMQEQATVSPPAGIGPVALNQALTALEQTLIPHVMGAEAAIFLWATLSQSREYLNQPEEVSAAVVTALREREELFRSVVENSPASVFIVDEQFRVVYTNDQLLNLVGFRREEVVGQNLQVFLDDESRQLLADHHVRRQRGEHVPRRYEFNIVHKDGEKRRVEVSSVALKGPAGNVRTLAQLSDVTEGRRLERQIEESLSRRERQVQTTTEVAQEIASAPALEELYRRVVTLVKERFGYYHAQLFLVDRMADRLRTVAGYGEIGQQFLEQGHSIPMTKGVVGRAGAGGQPVLSSDVSVDPEWIYHPLLPDTKGELAVPIILRRSQNGTSHDEVLGVLDVQSDQAGVLTEEDQLVLEGLCGQIAIAIESTRLRQETEESLQELEYLYRAASREGWSRFRKQMQAVSYLYDQAGVVPADDVWTERIALADEGGAFAGTTPGKRPIALAPLAVHGETLGVLGIETDPQDPLSEDDLALIEGVSEQVAQALESARLFEEEQRARMLLDVRVNQLDCLNDIGRKIDEVSGVGELLEWVAQRVPAAIQFPESCRVAIEFEGRVYGAEEALVLPRQMVQNLRIGGENAGRICIAYTQPRDFLNEESALLGDIARRVSGYVENQRLLESTQDALAETEILYQAARLAATFESLDSTLHSVVDSVAEALPADLVVLYRLDVAQESVVDFYRGGSHADVADVLPFDELSEGLMGWVLRGGQPALSPKGAADPRESSRSARRRAEHGHGAMVVVPIRYGDTVLGILTAVNNLSSRDFVEKDVELMLALASQAAVAIENATLIEQARTRAEEQAALNELGREMALCQDMDAVVSEAYQGVSRLLSGRATNFSVALYEAEWDEILTPLWVLDGEVKRPYERVPAGRGGLPEYLIRTRRSLLIAENVAERIQALGIEHTPFRVSQEPVSWLGVPLLIGERVIGAMAVLSYTTPGLYDEHDQELLAAVADRTAIALESVWLLEESRSRAEQQVVLNRVSQALAASQDMYSLLDRVYEGALQLLHAQGLYVTVYDEEVDRVRLAMRMVEGVDDRVVERSRAAHQFDRGGLTDYLIRTREPLLLPDQVQGRAAEMGVSIVSLQEGRMPASWLGAPILLGDRVLGTIVMLSYDRPRAYDLRCQELLVALANQVGLAIQNMRLLEETRSALAEVEATHRSYLRRGWQEHLGQRRALARSGFVYDAGDALAAPTTSAEASLEVVAAPDFWRAEMGEALETPLTQSVQDKGGNLKDTSAEPCGLAVPINLRGQVLGVLGVESPTGDRAWTEEDRALLEAVSEQLAQTLESARLFADTQRLAERERIIGEIAAKIRASTDIRSIVETTAVELGRVLGTSRSIVRLTVDEDGSGSGDGRDAMLDLGLEPVGMADA